MVAWGSAPYCCPSKEVSRKVPSLTQSTLAFSGRWYGKHGAESQEIWVLILVLTH